MIVDSLLYIFIGKTQNRYCQVCDHELAEFVYKPKSTLLCRKCKAGNDEAITNRGGNVDA